MGQQILREKSKDLQIAAWITEALAHLHGLAGIRDGLNLMRAIQGAFWEKAHPENGDLELRRGLYEFLDDPKMLPVQIRSVPLTQVEGAPHLSYSYRKYVESRKTDNEFKRAKSETERSLLEGNLRGEEFDQAVAQTSRAFYVDLLRDLVGCREVIERSNQDLRERWPASLREHPPQFSQVLTALDEVERVAKQLLGRKPAPEPIEETRLEDEPPSDQEEGSETDADEGSFEMPLEEAATRPSQASRSRRPARSGPVSELESTSEAHTRIIDAAHYLRRADPADPASYLVLRALQAGELYRREDVLASGDLPPPGTEVRERLYQMSRTADGEQWADLLNESEQAMGRPEGRGWLDPHFYSARALEALGHHDAARACNAVLATWLQDHEPWPASHLRDGTPCASGPTRDWIERACQKTARPVDGAGEIRTMKRVEVASSRDDDTTSMANSVDGEAEKFDPWKEAQILAHSGQLNEAISVMVQAVRHARTGRERFLLTLRQAELCLSSDRPGLALPLLEMLAQRIDDLRLDQWEDGSLCARVLSHLYRCLKGRDEARAAAVYNRLCQLDAGEALLLGGT